jgi:hypothetical protein
MTTASRFHQLAYTPANSVLSIIFTAGTYDLGELMTVAHAKEFLGGKADKLAKLNEEDRDLFVWYSLAVTNLLAQAAQRGADGCAPPITLEAIEELANFVCDLTLLPYRGEVSPRCLVRWSNSPQGRIIDIVPSDPRWGGDDIPDWSKPA